VIIAKYSLSLLSTAPPLRCVLDHFQSAKVAHFPAAGAC
jgi:hypothetical protein